MNSKMKLLAVASMVAIMVSGCSSYRGASQAGVSTGGVGAGAVAATGQVARAGQVAGAGQVRGFGQQRSHSAVVATDSCAACAAAKAQSTYTYKPATPVAAVPAVQAPRPVANGKSQQYYIDRWNRQQAQLAQQQRRPVAPVQQAPRPVAPSTNYAAYGQQQQGQSNTTYYDYSSAGRTTEQAPVPTPPPTTVAASNKSIYTGSYQKPSYTPTTYSGGTAAKTNTAVQVASTSGAGGSYIVKKGDTVFEIMRQTGVYWKDIISLNSLQPPYNINPGQNIRLK